MTRSTVYVPGSSCKHAHARVHPRCSQVYASIECIFKHLGMQGRLLNESDLCQPSLSLVPIHDEPQQETTLLLTKAAPQPNWTHEHAEVESKGLLSSPHSRYSQWRPWQQARRQQGRRKSADAFRCTPCVTPRNAPFSPMSCDVGFSSRTPDEFDSDPSESNARPSPCAVTPLRL